MSASDPDLSSRLVKFKLAEGIFCGRRNRCTLTLYTASETVVVATPMQNQDVEIAAEESLHWYICNRWIPCSLMLMHPAWYIWA